MYEWDQTLSEVNIYIEVPPGVTAKLLDVAITRERLTVAIKGKPPYINVSRGAEAGRRCRDPCAGPVGSVPIGSAAVARADLIPPLLLLTPPCAHGPRTQEDFGSAVKASESYWTLGRCGPHRLPLLPADWVVWRVRWAASSSRQRSARSARQRRLPPALLSDADGRELHIELNKATKGETWPAALRGHALDAASTEEEQKRLMLERFQQEVRR